MGYFFDEILQKRKKKKKSVYNAYQTLRSSVNILAWRHQKLYYIKMLALTYLVTWSRAKCNIHFLNYVPILMWLNWAARSKMKIWLLFMLLLTKWLFCMYSTDPECYRQLQLVAGMNIKKEWKREQEDGLEASDS
jgi:hypothetical protein